jgi:hypothetical protein
MLEELFAEPVTLSRRHDAVTATVEETTACGLLFGSEEQSIDQEKECSHLSPAVSRHPASSAF